MTSIVVAHKIWNAYTVKILSFIKSRWCSGLQVAQRCSGLQCRKKKTLQVFSYEFCQISKNSLPYRTLLVAASVLWWWSFLFSMWRFSSFLNFKKMWANFIKATLREVWQWHSRSQICKINGKSGFKFFKLIFCG